MRILILAAGVGSGHNSAAQAIETALYALQPDSEVRRIDVLDTTNSLYSTIYDDGYFTLVAQAPWLVGWGYDREDPPFKLNALAKFWDELNTAPLLRDIREHDPDLVIATHFLPARLVSLLMARGQLNTILTIVTTDFDFQGLWLSSPVSRVFTAREETRQHLLRFGMPADRVSASGIPVRPEFTADLDADEVRERYGLSADSPIVLISAGAAGGPKALQVVRQTLDLDHDFQAIVVCGRNEELKEQVEQLVEGRERYHVLSFTHDMPALMRISSLFVGKPGGLSSSECMAAGLPMVIVDPIPGQEERNADYLIEEGAAIRCNYATTVGYKIGLLLGDPERLAAMRANAARIGHADAAEVVARLSIDAVSLPLWVSRDAQKLMSQVSEHGEPIEPDSDRVKVLCDPDTGDSLALVAASELAALGATPGAARVELGKTHLRALRWQPDRVALAAAGKWVLGKADTRMVAIRD